MVLEVLIPALREPFTVLLRQAFRVVLGGVRVRGGGDLGDMGLDLGVVSGVMGGDFYLGVRGGDLDLGVVSGVRGGDLGVMGGDFFLGVRGGDLDLGVMGGVRSGDSDLDVMVGVVTLTLV